MTASIIANLLAFAVFFTALFRARLVALALVPPCLLILARTTGLVDTSSASHPLRWIVPLACAGLAGIAAWKARALMADAEDEMATLGPLVPAFLMESWIEGKRALIASLLILASCGPDLLALHPFFWERFAEWPLVPLQIALCVTIIVVLLVPERWMKWA